MSFSKEFIKNCESCIGGTGSPVRDVGLWPTSGSQTQNPELDCLDRGRMLSIPDPAPNKQRGHECIVQRDSGAATRGYGLRAEFPRGGLAIIQFIRHPIPVEEVESVSKGTLRGAVFYTV